MRLIDADALVEKAYWHGEHPDVGNPFADGVEAVDMSDIENAPTIEAEPVRHGRWERYCDDKFMGYGADGKIKYRKVYTYECDNCRHGTVVKTYYCPNCGAKMDALTFEEASRKLGQQAAETLKKLKEEGHDTQR